jgi:hypothetical protein
MILSDIVLGLAHVDERQVFGLNTFTGICGDEPHQCYSKFYLVCFHELKDLDTLPPSTKDFHQLVWLHRRHASHTVVDSRHEAP